MKTNGIAIFLLAIVIVGLTSHAYVYTPPPMKWNKTYGGTHSDMAYFVQQTNDNGYIITGHTSSSGAGSADFWLVKTDSNGNTQWNKTYGGTSRDEAYCVQQTSDEGYIIAGSTRSFGAGFSDFWIVKTNSNGETVWNKTYGGLYWDAAYSIQQASDEGYIATGSTNSFGSGSEDFWIVKTDTDGRMQWNKTFGGLYDDTAYVVQQTNDGGYVVCGYTSSFGAGYEDFCLVKIDSNGNIMWNKTYGRENSEYAYFVQQTNDNGYIIAGSTYSLATEFDIWLVKTDSSGNMQWNKTYGGSLDEETYCVQQTSDEGYIIAGTTYSSANKHDILLIKTDSAGNIEWNQTYGGAEKDEAYCVEQTSDEGYIIAGTTYSFGVGWDPDFWMVRLAGVHDIAIQNVVSHKTVVGEGYCVPINITIKNWGRTETFNVTVYANTTNAGTQLVTLTSGNSTTVLFLWNTTGWVRGNYIIKAMADTVHGEIDITDNTLIDGTVLVTFTGDVNGDGRVRVDDILAIALAFGSSYGDPRYDPNLDINGDLKIRVDDVLSAALNFGLS